MRQIRIIESSFQNGVYLLDIPDSIDVLMPLEQIISELPTNVVFLYVLDVTSANQTKFGQVKYRQQLSHKHLACYMYTG